MTDDQQLTGLEDLTAEDLAWPSTEDDLLALSGNQQTYAYLEVGEAGWHHRATGFRVAAITIAERIERDPHLAHGLVYPLGNCWRHHLELQLKQLLADLRAFRGEAQPANGDRGHSLLKLWNAARPMLNATLADEPEGETDIVEAVIRQLEKLDSDGQDFRYPNRTDGKEVLGGVQVLDVANLNTLLMGISSFFQGALTGVYEYHQAQLEMN